MQCLSVVLLLPKCVNQPDAQCLIMAGVKAAVGPVLAPYKLEPSVWYVLYSKCEAAE